MKESTKTRLTTAWRILVAAGMVGIIVLAGIFAYMFYEHEIKEARRNRVWTLESDYSDSYVIEHHQKYLRLKDAKTSEYLTPKLSHIYDENLKDSITVFRQEGKRGFLNIYTGEIVVPAQYDKAWVFSEGLGAAVKDGKVGFVNKKGETVISFQYGYSSQWKNQVDFLFKGGYCTVIDQTTGKQGLIDKLGKWAIKPEYDYINKPEREVRIVKLGEKYGVMDSTLQFIIPAENDYIELYEDGILLRNGYEKRLMAYDGKTVLQPFVYDNVCYLTYGTDKVNDAGEIVLAKCDMNSYEVAGRYGLMDKNGKIITKPLYTDIDAISKDIFVCDVEEGDLKITINARGEVVK